MVSGGPCPFGSVEHSRQPPGRQMDSNLPTFASKQLSERSEIAKYFTVTYLDAAGVAGVLTVLELVAVSFIRYRHGVSLF
jgi:hypothetical protein